VYSGKASLRKPRTTSDKSNRNDAELSRGSLDQPEDDGNGQLRSDHEARREGGSPAFQHLSSSHCASTSPFKAKRRVRKAIERSVAKGSSPTSKLSPKEVSSLLKSAESLIGSGKLQSTLHPKIPGVGPRVEVASGSDAAASGCAIPSTPRPSEVPRRVDDGTSSDDDSFIIDLSGDESSVDADTKVSTTSAVEVKKSSCFPSSIVESESSKAASDLSHVKKSVPAESSNLEPFQAQPVGDDRDASDVLEIDLSKDMLVRMNYELRIKSFSLYFKLLLSSAVRFLSISTCFAPHYQLGTISGKLFPIVRFDGGAKKDLGKVAAEQKTIKRSVTCFTLSLEYCFLKNALASCLQS